MVAESYYWYVNIFSHATCTGLWFPHGVLLYGPAGVGKSLLTQAIMSETRAHVISVSATDLMLGWV